MREVLISVSTSFESDCIRGESDRKADELRVRVEGNILYPSTKIQRNFNDRDIKLSQIKSSDEMKKNIMISFMNIMDIPVSVNQTSEKEKGQGIFEVNRVPVVLLFIPSSGCTYALCQDFSATRLNIPIRHISSDVSLVVCGGEFIVTSSYHDGPFVDIEIQQVFECIKMESCGLPVQYKVVHNAQPVKTFISERLDFVSEQWRVDIMAASGVRSISARPSATCNSAQLHDRTQLHG
mmetsp:Transcript_5740/g.9355  ORF Transcript_5740/g.9355 Transcript_5740/m.9355 type:complete len:237 (+) Transcript_5740:3-713(+)